MHSLEELEIIRLFEDGDRALISGNAAELQRIYSDDYVQCDERGNFIGKDELIRKLSHGEIRFVAMRSTGRSIRFLHDACAVVHGSEEDEVERDGRFCEVHYIYMDVVVKRKGQWHIVASQLAKLE